LRRPPPQIQGHPHASYQTLAAGKRKGSEIVPVRLPKQTTPGRQQSHLRAHGCSLSCFQRLHDELCEHWLQHHQSQPAAYYLHSRPAPHVLIRTPSPTQKIPELNRKNPLTAHIHAARPFAPNYHEDYADREGRHEFIRKRGGLCEAICDVEKTYGVGKYFRKLK
jgi:hypothetical protein